MHVPGLLLLMAFNDLAATRLVEVQGAVVTKSAYKIVGLFGQIVRRSINTITAITAPLLFHRHLAALALHRGQRPDTHLDNAGCRVPGRWRSAVSSTATAASGVASLSW